jgi:hypothetical protein
MPIVPVRDYDGARYPTLDEAAAERREFLRRVGLSAIAAALGPAAIGCHAEGSGGPPPVTVPQRRQASPTPPVMPAGTPAPPRWPGTRGALVGGRSIEVTFADGSPGRVAVAAVFAADHTALEAALIDAQPKIAEAVRARMKQEPPSFIDDPERRARIEAAMLAAIQKLVATRGLQSVSIASVYTDAARTELAAPAAPAPPPARAPAAMAPMASATTAPPEPRRLPRAGARCPIHGSGCTASEDRR